MPYLTKRALSGLRDYKYKPAGYTFGDAVHQPFWNFITNHILPSWLAPNLITLTGMSALIAAYCITASYAPDFEQPLERWLYLMAGCSVFFYLHMDALDGKQARRTKTSSPLGQLFDHGCDALAVHLILVTMATSLQLTHEWRTVVAMMYVYIPWWLAHWEEYHTGMMCYGNGLWGVTEANYAVVFLHIYTYIVGPTGWTATPLAGLFSSAAVTEVLPKVVCEFLGGLTITNAFILFFFFLGMHLLGGQVLRVFMLAGSKQLEETTLPPAERGNKTLGKGAAVAHLLQIFGTMACGAALMSLPASDVPGQARVHYATFGVVYALQATRLIMAHMAKEPFHVAVWPLLLMGAQVANHFVAVFEPYTLGCAVNAVVVAGYLHYVLSMIGEICAFLGINALTIKTKQI